MNYHAPLARKTWLTERDCDLADFARLVEEETDPRSVPNALAVKSRIPFYDGEQIRRGLADPGKRRELLAEWSEVFLSGPGVVVFKGAYADTAVIDEATGIFDEIVAAERRANRGGGDHFGRPGANTRIWNSHEKLCMAAPRVFARYYANDVIAGVCEAWLGPAYQITAQVNTIHPGGDAQMPHRDYHLGFQAGPELERYPLHAHRLSPVLTLQGAIAHCDMPIEAGPTKLLPFSQRYDAGYFAGELPALRDYFEAKHVQLPLAKGDALFFSPAVMHAGGANRTRDIVRIANLLQVSSAFGRAMETLDRTRMSLALYPDLLEMRRSGALSAIDAANVVAACAEGYSFPTNLDFDPPLGGLAPKTQQALTSEALAGAWPLERFAEEIAAQARRRLSH